MNRREFLKIASVAGLMLPVSRVVSAFPFRYSTHGEQLELVQKSSFAMGSVVSFDLYTSDRKLALESVRKVMSRLKELEALFSVYQPDSEISRMNRSAGKKSVSLSPETLSILDKAIRASEQSAGYFDVTIEPLMELYGFRAEADEKIIPPTDRELAQLENAIGIRNLKIEGNSAGLLNEKSNVDLGGIGCGFAVDEALKILKSDGIDNFLINFSGDLFISGRSPESETWEVTILNPADQEKSPVLQVTDCAVSTSGSYQNRRSSGSSQSWGHLIDPRSRKPSEPELSFSVITQTATDADIFSTAGYLNPVQADGWKSSGLIRDFVVI